MEWNGKERDCMVRYADRADYEVLKTLDIHIREEELAKTIDGGRILVMYEEGEFAGWLRFGLFWDNTPFMNMLYVMEGKRGRGYGRKLVDYWEKEMKKACYKRVLTSTLSNEEAQFFYRKLGYGDCGGLLLPGEALEIIMMKEFGGFLADGIQGGH